MERTDIIAELGANWLGDFGLAEDMIAAAAESGADYVKTQTWRENKLRPGPWDEDGRRNIYRKAQIDTIDRQNRLIELCQKYSIKYLTSIFDPSDFDIIPVMDAIKIPGVESLNESLLDECAKRFNKVFLSAAGQKSDEMIAIANRYRSNSKVILMHGVYLYPCPLLHSNMWRIPYFQSRYPHVGYSDHTEGVDAPYIALGMGVDVIEKHFTIDNKLEGKDNAFSCLPATLKQICDFRDKVYLMTRHSDVDEGPIKAYKGRWGG